MERETRIKEFWAGKLITVPQAALDMLPLPEATVDFLRDVGLPMEPMRSENVVNFNPSKTKVVNLNGIRYLQIGYMDNQESWQVMPICLRESTGEVYLDNSAYIDWHVEASEESTAVALYYTNQDIQSLLLYFVAINENLKSLVEVIIEWEELRRRRNVSRAEMRKMNNKLDMHRAKIGRSLDAELREIDASALMLGDDRKIMPYWLEEFLILRNKLR
jgi:hypothetical protein